YEPRISYSAAYRQPSDGSRNWPEEINPNNKVTTVPPAGTIWLVLVSYIVVLGPGTYYSLKKLGRPELIWLVGPGLALLTSLGIYLAGIFTGGDPLVISRLTVVTAGETVDGKLAG